MRGPIEIVFSDTQRAPEAQNERPRSAPIARSPAPPPQPPGPVVPDMAAPASPAPVARQARTISFSRAAPPSAAPHVSPATETRAATAPEGAPAVQAEVPDVSLVEVPQVQDEPAIPRPFEGRRVFRAGGMPARSASTAPPREGEDVVPLAEGPDAAPAPVHVEATAAPAAPARQLNGWLEGFSNGMCRGWVFDTQDPEGRVEVEAVWDGKVVATVTADEYRTSLVRAGIGDGAHGFVLPVPATLPEPSTPGQVLIIRTAPDHVTIGTVRLPRRESLDSLVDLARTREREGDLTGALAYIDDVLAVDPGMVKALWIGARLAYNLKDQEKARILAERAAYLDPSNPRPAVILARIADNEGRGEDALRLWQTIPEGDTAYRESLIKSSRHLLGFGRHLEALQPALKALRLDPEEKTVLKVAAECYTALGASSLALDMWRRFLGVAPGDKTGTARVKALEGSVGATGPAPDDPDFLVNSSLRNWTGASRGETQMRIALADGALIAPLTPGETLSYQACAPQEVRFDRLPHYGLRLETEGAGSVLAFRLAGEAGERLGRGWRVSFEVRSTVASAPYLPLNWMLVGDLDDPDAYRRFVWSGHATPRARLLPFDLTLSAEEAEMAAGGALHLVLTVEGAGGVLVHAPRKVQRLFVPSEVEAGGEDLVALRNLARIGGRSPANRPAEPAQEVPPTRLAYPFFDIVLWAARGEGLSATAAGAVLQTVAPFAGYLLGITTERNEADSPLARLARDTRFPADEAWDPHGSSAEWIVFLRADAEIAGEHWLTELYDFAVTTRSSVVVYRSGVTDCILVLKDDLLRWWDEREVAMPGEPGNERIHAFAQQMCH